MSRGNLELSSLATFKKVIVLIVVKYIMAEHIRPQVRSRPTPNTAKSHDVDLDALLHSTRSSVDKWLGGPNKMSAPVNMLKEVPVSNAADSSIASSLNKLVELERQEEEEEERHLIQSKEPKGILRKSKYSRNGRNKSKPTQLPTKLMSDLTIRNDTQETQIIMSEEGAEESSEKIKVAPKLAVKDVVVEHTSPVRQTLAHDPLAVEGFVTQMEDKNPSAGDTKTNITSGDQPVVFTSMEQLLTVAGTLPTDSILRDARVIEADLEFSVMSSDDFKQQMDDECNLDKDLFEGHYNVFGSDEEDNDSKEDNIMNMDEELMDDDTFRDDEHGMEGRPGPEPRAFIKVWTLLSSWITPEAIEMLKHPSTCITPNYSDMAASRCAGVMAMVNMHLPRARKELGIPEDDVKSVKRRVSDWLRCLDYSQQTHKLDTNLWRCLTVVLIDIVLVARPSDIPPTATAVGMTREEYEYLTRSAIKNLEQGSL